MIATTVAITAANSISAANAARANALHLERCKLELLEYTPDKASVQEMQSYAGCVNFIYPQESSNITYETKIVVAVLLLSVLIGFIIGWVKDKDISSAILGAMGGLCAAATGVIILLGIMFVFS